VLLAVCNVLPYVVVILWNHADCVTGLDSLCCSVLQYVAACCSVLQLYFGVALTYV